MMEHGQFLLPLKKEIMRRKQLYVKQVLDRWVFWVCGGFLVGEYLGFIVTFGMRPEKLCLFIISKKFNGRESRI